MKFHAIELASVINNGLMIPLRFQLGDPYRATTPSFFGQNTLPLMWFGR
jgi:hypothetical protein